MTARQIIEAEDPKTIFRQAREVSEFERPASITAAVNMAQLSLRAGAVCPLEFVFSPYSWYACKFKAHPWHHRPNSVRGKFAHPENLLSGPAYRARQGREGLIDKKATDEELIAQFRKAANETGFGREIEVMRYSESNRSLALLTRFRLSDGKPTLGDPGDPRWNGEVSQVVLLK